jgi:hypothetical protein
MWYREFCCLYLWLFPVVCAFRLKAYGGVYSAKGSLKKSGYVDLLLNCVRNYALHLCVREGGVGFKS